MIDEVCFEDIICNCLSERLSQGMTQVELSKKSGVSQANIAKFENGLLPNISVNTLVLILGAFGADMVIDFDTGEEW